MIFSPTEKGTFKRCARQAVLTSKNGLHLTPMIGPASLSLGSLIHRGFHLWLEAPDKDNTSFQEHVLTASLETETAIRARYKAQIGSEIDDSELSPYYEGVSLATKMADNYQIRWKTPIPEGYRLIKAEVSIMVPVPGTEHVCVTCNGTGNQCIRVHDSELWQTCEECHGGGMSVHYLKMRLDGLIQHIQTGRFDILEHKTYGQRPKEEDLLMNDQFTCYKWGVEQLKLNEDTDSMIAYDGLWKREGPPRGRTFNDLHARYLIPRTREAMKEFAAMLPHELNHMAAIYAVGRPNPIDPRVTKTIPWNGCWDCKMKPLCLAMTAGEDLDQLLNTKYTQRTDDADVEETDDAAE